MPDVNRRSNAKPCPAVTRTFPPRPIAAPSWVIPGTVYENCRFLEGKVDEAALLFFDAEACLAYTRQDLPVELAALDLSYHVHLPLSPSWEKGGAFVAEMCLRLMEKVDFLGAARAVVHPPGSEYPDAGAPLLESFAARWQNAGRSPADVFIENTRENDLAVLLENERLIAAGVGLCLDLGHMLAYGQKALAQYVFKKMAQPGAGGPRVGMVHCNAPGSGEGGEKKSAHLPLDRLDNEGATLGKALCAVLDPEGIIVAEFFSWEYVARSLPVIREWDAGREPGFACGGC
ncbi:MAG: hypothetical protein DELT_00901 [Desulfovibrio sp.]